MDFSSGTHARCWPPSASPIEHGAHAASSRLAGATRPSLAIRPPLHLDAFIIGHVGTPIRIGASAMRTMRMRALWLGSAWVAMASVAGRCWPMSSRARIPPGSPPTSPPSGTIWSGIYCAELGAANARNQCNDFTQEMVEQSTTGFAGGAHARLQKQWSWTVAGAARIQIR